jgi:hypothetical protein
MAFDAGAIEARLTIDTAEASADLDKIEARVKAFTDAPHVVKFTADTAPVSGDIAKIAAEIKALDDQAHTVKFGAVANTAEASGDIAKIAAEVKALTGTPHNVHIGAVFDTADISLARRAFQLLDQAISTDAMQRLRSSPQGSVLGALNALFSPHPVIGGPSPQQAAANGLLGQMFSSQGGANTVRPAAAENPAVQGPEKVTVTGEAAQGQSAAGAGALADAADAEKAAAAEQALAAGALTGAAGDLRDAASAIRYAYAAQIASLGKFLGGSQRGGGALPVVAPGTAAGAAGGGEGALPVAGAAAAAEALSRFDGEIQKAFDDYALLANEMNDLREPAIIAALPELAQFDTVLKRIKEDLAALDQPGQASAAALARVQANLDDAGTALDHLEHAMPQAVADLEAMRASASGAAAAVQAVAAATDRYANVEAEMAAISASRSATAGGQGGSSGQSAAAQMLALAAAATTAAEAAQYASAAQKVFTGTETDVGTAAADAAAKLKAMAGASTSAGDASRYAFAMDVAGSIAAKAATDQAAAGMITYGSAAKDAEAAITASLESVSNASVTAAKGTGLFNDSIANGLPVWAAGAGRFGALTGHLQLFGGALTSVGVPAILGAVSGIHLLTEAVIETAGTLIPAAVAFTAFGIAAVPTVTDLYSQMQSLHTVTQAYNTTLYPLTGTFAKVAAAVQPQVYTLFGEALVFAGHNTGAFQALATGAGSVLDQLGARFVYATTQGQGFSVFAQKATEDLSIWGNNIGNLGGIIGGTLKVLPGYAQIIGNVFGAVTHDIEDLVNSGIGQAFLKVGLLAHGGLIYVGLLGTAFAKLASGAFPLIGNLAATVATRVEGLGAAGAAAAKGLDGITAASAEAGALPWGWIAIAAAGVGFLVYQLLNAKTAAQQFGDSVQSAIQKVELGGLGAALTTDILDYTGALKQATAQTTQLQAATAHTVLIDVGKSLQEVTVYSQATYQAKQNVADYGAALQVAQQDQGTYNANLATAAKVFGSNQAALAALTGAGITSTQMLTGSKQAFAEVIIEAQGYDDTIRAVTQSAGRYGAAQNALNFSAGNSANALGQVVSSMSKVTQAEDALLSTITAAPEALDTFEQGIYTLAQNLNTATGSTASTSFTLGHLKSSANLAGAALGGTTQASYALNQAFYSQVDAGQKLVDSLQSQNISTGNLQTVIATTAGQMLGFAGTNTAARTVIADLINNALGPGTVSLQSLNHWVGANSTSLGGMNNIIAQSVINASQLAGVLQSNLNQMLAQAAANALGGQKALDTFATGLINGDNASTLLANDGGAKVIAMFQQMYQGDVPKAKNAFVDWAENGLGMSQSAATNLWTALNNGLNPALGGTSAAALTASQALEQHFIADLKSIGADSPAVNAELGTFANAVLTTGDNSDATQGARAQLIKDLEAAGLNAHDATAMVNGLQTQIDGLHGKSVPVTVTATAQGTLNAIAHLPGANPSNLDSSLLFAASGMYVTGGTPGKDSVLIAAQAGEVVVPVAMVNAGAVDHLRGSIPGFAAGGMVNLDAPGQWAATQGGSWAQKVEQAWATAAQGAFEKSAAAAATAAAASFVGSQGASGGIIQSLMKNMAAAKGWTGAEWDALASVEAREAGWSMTATNPSSGAYGLAQFINGPSEYAQYGGNSTTAMGQITGMLNYISSRYGDPEAAWAHEMCVPLDVEIITRRGWLTYDQLRAGDETIGYNSETGHNEWTPVNEVHVYDDAPLVRLTNKTWEATCTPNHRWVATKHKHVGRAGKNGRTKNEYLKVDEFIASDAITSRHALRLAAMADLGEGPAISDEEAELLGWVMGDGSVAHIKSKKGSDPEHWRTGTGSKVSIRLYQSKPEHVKAIDALVAGLVFNRATRPMKTPKGQPGLPLVTWEFSRGYSAELLKRSGYDHKNPVPFVLSLSAEQRAAFIRGLFGAEGTLSGGGTFKGQPGYPMTRTYYQNDGAKQDAIILAIYLSGMRPGVSEADHRGMRVGEYTASKLGAVVRETKPFIGGERILREDAGRGPVWCVSTSLGSWTMRQGRQVMLTGNSYGWYDQGGSLKPGYTLAYNGTGRTEQVTSPSQGDRSQAALNAIGSKLDRLIQVTSQVPAGVGAHVGGAINGSAHDASFRSRYPRGGS